jgi:hypothetical protein
MHSPSGTVGTFRDRPLTQDPFVSVPAFASNAASILYIPKEAGTFRPEHWPVGSSLELGPLPSAVSCARIHARLVVAEWDLPDLVDAVELIVSELVTNSVQACAELDGSQFAGIWVPGPPPVRLWLGTDCQRVLVQVWDGNHQLPVRQDADPEAEGGRGLVLVESLSADWGSYRPAACSGKVVWAVLC